VNYGYDSLYRLTSETVANDPNNHNVTDFLLQLHRPDAERHLAFEIAFEFHRLDVVRRVTRCIRGVENLGALSIQGLQQYVRVERTEVSRSQGRIPDLGGCSAQQAGEKLVNRFCAVGRGVIRKNIDASNILRLNALRGNAAGVGDDDHMTDAAVARQLHASGYVDGSACSHWCISEEPVFAAIDIHTMAGEIQYQLVGPGTIDDLLDGVVDEVRSDLLTASIGDQLCLAGAHHSLPNSPVVHEFRTGFGDCRSCRHRRIRPHAP